MQVVEKKLTAPGIPKRSPIQVLTRPNPAWLPRSDEVGYVQGGVAVSERLFDKCALNRCWNHAVPQYKQIIGLRG